MYTYIYNVILLWQLHAMNSFLDDRLYEGGRCRRSFWRLSVKCWYVSSDTNFQNVASWYMYLQNVQGGAQNIIPLIVHVTHFYYYKNIW